VTRLAVHGNDGSESLVFPINPGKTGAAARFPLPAGNRTRTENQVLQTTIKFVAIFCQVSGFPGLRGCAVRGAHSGVSAFADRVCPTPRYLPPRRPRQHPGPSGRTVRRCFRPSHNVVPLRGGTRVGENDHATPQVPRDRHDSRRSEGHRRDHLPSLRSRRRGRWSHW